MTQFAINLYRLRQSKNWTQKKLCEKLDIVYTTYQNYELGHSEPRLTLLIKIAELYGVTLDQLAGIEEVKIPC